MGSETVVSKEEERATPDYLAQLLKDKRQIQPFGAVFLHLERILDEEIDRVRQALFQATKNPLPLELPEESGPTVQVCEKLYVPASEYPEFNFVGRILGPRGMTAKQLEQSTGCRIMVRGRGSTRDKKREEVYKGKSNWEHLNDDLHVLITVEDTETRARLRLNRAVEEVKKLLIPAPEGEDDLKKLQLMELAIINGTYRDCKQQIPPPNLALPAPPVSMLAGPPALILPPHMIRTSGPAGSPIFLAPRLPIFTSGSPILSPPILPNGAIPPSLLSPPTEAPGIIFHVDLTQGGLPSPIFDYGPVPPLQTPQNGQPQLSHMPNHQHQLHHQQHQHNHHHDHHHLVMSEQNRMDQSIATLNYVR